MKDPHGFDELARQKLAGRHHAFDEAHWSHMEQLLRERHRKPKAWWPWMAATLLLLGGAGALTVLNDTGQAGVTMRPVVADVPPADHTATVVAPRNEVATAFAHADAEPPAGKAPMQSTSSPRAKVHADPGIASGDPRVNDGMRMRVKATSDRKHSASSGSQRTNDPIVSVVTDAGIKPDAGTSVGDPAGEPDLTLVDEPAAPAEPAGEQGTGADPEPAVDDLPPSGVHPDPVGPTLAHPGSDGDTTAADPLPAVATTPDPASGWTVRTPFELTALGGLFNTSGSYSGAATEGWAARTEHQTAAGFGLELAKNLGEHFSAGIGLHYAHYRERLLADETTRADRWITTGYAFVPYDTSVLVITDTITIGATDYYVTELVPTTINVLEQTSDTSYTTTVVRERRSVVNTVSYVEVPLFVDAHFSTGRWVFGIRGGPTVGLLTGRQGKLPDSAEETGYSDLTERDFSAVTLGCSARAYARYRLGRSFAVGIGPAWRQQLGNSLGDGALRRRGQALGGYLSLSYHFGGSVPH